MLVLFLARFAWGVSSSWSGSRGSWSLSHWVRGQNAISPSLWKEIFYLMIIFLHLKQLCWINWTAKACSHSRSNSTGLQTCTDPCTGCWTLLTSRGAHEDMHSKFYFHGTGEHMVGNKAGLELTNGKDIWIEAPVTKDWEITTQKSWEEIERRVSNYCDQSQLEPKSRLKKGKTDQLIMSRFKSKQLVQLVWINQLQRTDPALDTVLSQYLWRLDSCRDNISAFKAVKLQLDRRSKRSKSQLFKRKWSY